MTTVIQLCETKTKRQKHELLIQKNNNNNDNNNLKKKTNKKKGKTIQWFSVEFANNTNLVCKTLLILHRYISINIYGN